MSSNRYKHTLYKKTISTSLLVGLFVSLLFVIYIMHLNNKRENDPLERNTCLFSQKKPIEEGKLKVQINLLFF